MKTKTINLILSIILAGLFVFSSNCFANDRLGKRYITREKEYEKPQIKSKENPVVILNYMKQRGTWELLNVDSVKYDSEGRLVESFIVGEDIRENITYDQEGNKIQSIITRKGVNEEKKIWKYDNIKKNYRIEQIYYAWENNNWQEFYHHIKRIERNASNEITSIKIYTVGGAGDTALNSTYFINYGSDGRASEYYSINNFEGANDTNVTYTQMRWAKWEGQLTENDFSDKNALEYAVLDKTLEDPGVLRCIYTEDGYIRYEHYESGYFLKNPMMKLENGGFVHEYTESLVVGTDTTLVFSEKVTEENDSHGNITLSKYEVFEANTNNEKEGEINYELQEQAGYKNKYDAKDRFVEVLMIAYNIEAQTADTVEKTEYIYSDLSYEKNNSFVSNIVYPNPAKENINISTNEQFDMVHICDMSGRVIFRYKFSQNGSYDISSLKSGFYIIKLMGKKSSISSKFAVL